jgi:hypothetical protein
MLIFTKHGSVEDVHGEELSGFCPVRRELRSDYSYRKQGTTFPYLLQNSQIRDDLPNRNLEERVNYEISGNQVHGEDIPAVYST